MGPTDTLESFQEYFEGARVIVCIIRRPFITPNEQNSLRVTNRRLDTLSIFVYVDDKLVSFEITRPW